MTRFWRWLRAAMAHNPYIGGEGETGESAGDPPTD